MKRFLAIALLLMSVSLANAQAPTPLCTPGTSPTSGQPTCVPVNAANPLPISGSFSATLTGFLSNNVFATLTATGSTSASTALPAGATSVRITNNGTTVVSCTMATGAATGLVSNILVQSGSSVSRVVGTFDHIACIDQTGSVSNPVVIEGGSGLGNDSGGGGSGGGSSITTWAGGTLGAMANYGTSPGAVLAPGVNAFVTNSNANGPVVQASGSPIVFATDQTGPCTGIISVNQTASADLLTSVAKLNICTIILISATAQNISLVEGTGSVCATGIAALIGGTTASLAVAANSGFSAPAPFPWLKTKTTADHLCLLQSGVGNVSGIITYLDRS